MESYEPIDIISHIQIPIKFNILLLLLVLLLLRLLLLIVLLLLHSRLYHTVYPKKYAHGFCFAVLCCGYTLTDFPISIRLTSLALLDCPSASKATLMNMDKYLMWNHYERLHNHNKAKHNKTVCIFIGIYCISNLNTSHGKQIDIEFEWKQSSMNPWQKFFSLGHHIYKKLKSREIRVLHPSQC